MLPDLNKDMIFGVGAVERPLCIAPVSRIAEARNRALHFRGALPYVPGAHAVKVGFDHKSGWATDTSYVGNTPPRSSTLQ
jgi:hypothetical protein